MSNKVQEIIVSSIIKGLEAGVAAWRKPWTATGTLPKNLTSRKAYRGINLLTLSILGGGDEYFLTFKQIQAKKGKLQKGTKGIPVAFYTMIDDSKNIGKKFPLLRYYLVFPASKVEGIKIPESEDKGEKIEFSPIEECESFSTLPCPINYGGARACFAPTANTISLPNKETFISVNHFYATFFHEIGHALALPASNEDLSKNGSFGSETYSKEELIAEIFSCFCLSHCGILSDDVFDNGKAYLSGWLSALKKDPSLVIKAASQAQKRFDYFLKINGKAAEVEKPEIEEEN